MRPRTPSLLALAVVIAATPFLQGAGCSTHYGARLRGTATLDPSQAAEVSGKRVRIIYRLREQGTLECAADWSPCLRGGRWEPLHRCNATEPGAGQVPDAVAGGGATAISFDACTRMIGVDYRADIAAFVDADDNGLLGDGEIYGVYPGNPLTRDKESGALPLTIRLDRTHTR